nr:immunoglobulin heavy chain junction region [Macaca mulatta]MOX93777.1 immunoglobulin heavy chain junction region [Macaca mulatta]MOX94239.1 immunoglobulin heavy chain junction region [Macaca mulatta]MOX95080.1 immunoglobulin heavy chain junction region [Macaca mulatta]MOX95351.1 immunoglobulin heavy chain junction region [Macaca mulatta]
CVRDVAYYDGDDW